MTPVVLRAVTPQSQPPARWGQKGDGAGAVKPQDLSLPSAHCLQSVQRQISTHISLCAVGNGSSGKLKLLGKALQGVSKCYREQEVSGFIHRPQ